MKTKNLLFVVIALGAMVVVRPALADGPVGAYNADSIDQSDIQNGIVNADGAKEDPDHPMSPTARAYRNGLQNGRQQQQQEDARAVPPIPPLPPSMQPKGYAGYPQAAQVQAIPQQPVQQYRPAYQPQPQQYVQRSQPPVQVINVMPDPRYYEPAEQYGRAPSWRNRDEYSEQSYAYAQPVYQEPPVMYAPPPPPVIVQQPVYVQRAYPRYYAQPYYQDHGYVGFRGRGWGVGMGW